MYKEKLLKNSKLLLIIALLLIIIMILAVKLMFKKSVLIEIEDKCGKFINLISHTIEDENVCISRCRAQCESISRKYQKVEFNKNDAGCNSCNCYCK